MDAQQDVLRCLLYDYDTFFPDSLLGTCAQAPPYLDDSVLFLLLLI